MSSSRRYVTPLTRHYYINYSVTPFLLGLSRKTVYLENRTLLANVTSMSPNFNVSHLDAGTNYQIKVYVTHGPVTSPPVVVSAYTSRTPPETSGDSDDQNFVEMRGDSDGSDGGNVEQGVMKKGAVESSSGNSDGKKDTRGGRRGRLGGGDGKTEVGAVMAAVVAVAVLATMGGVWAWRRRWRWQGGGSVSAAARGPAGVRSGGKDSCPASSSSSGNPDVVPTLGSSFSKRSPSPRHFWNKDKAVEASAGGSTGRLPTLNENSSLGDTTAGGSGSGGAESSPCDSQRNSGACSTSTPTLSQKTVCSGGNSSPAESSRAMGGDSSSSLTSSLKTVCSVGTSTPTDGMKSRDSTSSPSQSPAAVGRGLSSGGGGSSSSNSSRRTAVITYRPFPTVWRPLQKRRGGTGRGTAAHECGGGPRCWQP
ncbi:hypothetical protein O3P69_017141 [Scylla paramamosain]|uniref:Fibronectin type-III domain-containing protein n=1 Tax=Scylla paramamosain TaxID=85552 RepID=A0AAW0TYS6_SCYPA